MLLAKTGNRIPLELLFAKPDKDQLRLSPHGTYLAWRGRVDGTLNLFIQTFNPKAVENGKSIIDETAKQLTFFTDRDACCYFTFTPDEKTILFLRDITRGSETYHLHAIDIDLFLNSYDGNTSSAQLPTPRNLILNPKITCAMGFTGGIQLWTASSSSSLSPRTVYLSTSKIGPYAMFWDISRVDIDTAETFVIEQNVMTTYRGRVYFLITSFVCLAMKSFLGAIKKIIPFTEFITDKLDFQLPGIPIEWFPDEDMQFRGRIEAHANLSFSFCAKARGANNKWKSLHTVLFERANLQLFGSSGGSGTARMEFSPTSSESDTVDVHLCNFGNFDTTTYERFDLKTNGHVACVANSNKVDIAGFVSHPKTRRAQYVMYEYEKTTTEALSTNASLADLEYLKSYFEPSVIFHIISRTYNCMTWIIYAVSDIGQQSCKDCPGGYFLFCKGNQNHKSIHLILPSRPQLSQYKLSPMKPINIKARDGEDILCYLSSPSNSEKKPLILLIHGGPQARDHWGFNPICQFLCNRGFRTLQVNYRGSTGFGERFLRLGMDGQFYKSLQTDIEDAAISLSGEDMAIMGASFGGYSALWNMTSTPNLYKCAVAICPLTVVGAANTQGSKMFGGSPLIAKYWYQVFGNDVSGNKEVARKASPLYQMHKISDGASIQLFHGENDPRAPFDHSISVVRELGKQIHKGKNISGEFISFADEGHGISKEGNVLCMYHHIETFLCKQFGIESTVPLFSTENSTATIRWSANGENNLLYKKLQ